MPLWSNNLITALKRVLNYWKMFYSKSLLQFKTMEYLKYAHSLAAFIREVLFATKEKGTQTV